jgi:hypothetical protein
MVPGTLSLDLFAVLLGGATALLPIYGRDILHTGPWGLGVLRGAPAVGALLTTVVLARHAIQARVGIRMFQAVIVFGCATVVFAVSHTVWLSILALAIMGAGGFGERGDSDDSRAVGNAGRTARPSRCRKFFCSSTHRASLAPSRVAVPRHCSVRCRRPHSAASELSAWRSCG